MRAVIAALSLCLIGSPAFAKSHHHHQQARHVARHGAHHPRSYSHRTGRPHRAVVRRAVVAVGYQSREPANTSGLAGIMARYLGTNPTGWAHNWCGQFLGIVARQIGLQPPSGFALARNWRNFGRAATPAPGVIAVFPNHVAVVTAVLGHGRVRTISGNHGHRVGYGDYAMRLAIAWRLPS